MKHVVASEKELIAKYEIQLILNKTLYDKNYISHDLFKYVNEKILKKLRGIKREG